MSSRDVLKASLTPLGSYELREVLTTNSWVIESIDKIMKNRDYGKQSSMEWGNARTMASTLYDVASEILDSRERKLMISGHRYSRPL